LIVHIVGGAEGVGAIIGLNMMADISKGYTIVILSNYDFPVAIDVYGKTKELVNILKSK
jgi:hypothetical protein